MRWRRSSAELRAFLRRLLPALLVGGLLWALIRPLYNPAICAAAQFLARSFEHPRAALVTPDGDYALLGRTDLRAGSAELRIWLTQIQFNLVPFLALVLALPKGLAARGWRRALAALAMLAVAHVLAIIWQLECFYAFSLGPWSAANYSDLARNVYGALRYLFDLPVTFALPLLLWLWAFPTRVRPLLGLEAGE